MEPTIRDLTSTEQSRLVSALLDGADLNNEDQLEVEYGFADAYPFGVAIEARWREVGEYLDQSKVRADTIDPPIGEIDDEFSDWDEYFILHPVAAEFFRNRSEPRELGKDVFFVDELLFDLPPGQARAEVYRFLSWLTERDPQLANAA